MYAEKSKLNMEGLVFSFDGEKISPQATPKNLGMEDGDMIEVNAKAHQTLKAVKSLRGCSFVISLTWLN